MSAMMCKKQLVRALVPAVLLLAAVAEVAAQTPPVPTQVVERASFEVRVIEATKGAPMVDPTLADLERDVEEAALTLGAHARQIFTRVILPQLVPAILTGVGLAFARAVGEYGSVIFIAGNIPGVSEILPLLIVIRLQQYDYAGAALIAATMLVGSLIILLALNLFAGRWVRRHG